MQETHPILVYMTAPDAGTAERIAMALVEEHLAACVNVLPGMRSTYRWQGQVETADELVLIAKTTRDAYPALEARVRALHPAACPCLLTLPVTGGFAPYLDWLAALGGP